MKPSTLRKASLILCFLVPIFLQAASYTFHIQPMGRLGGQIRFEFQDHLNRKITPDIVWFTVSERTEGRWKPVWSIHGHQQNVNAIEYGGHYSSSLETLAPKPLISGRVYGAFASDGHGGSAVAIFRFEKGGMMTFPDSPD